VTEALGSETEAKTLMDLETASRPRISVGYGAIMKADTHSIIFSNAEVKHYFAKQHQTVQYHSLLTSHLETTLSLGDCETCQQ